MATIKTGAPARNISGPAEMGRCRWRELHLSGRSSRGARRRTALWALASKRLARAGLESLGARVFVRDVAESAGATTWPEYKPPSPWLSRLGKRSAADATARRRANLICARPLERAPPRQRKRIVNIVLVTPNCPKRLWGPARCRAPPKSPSSAFRSPARGNIFQRSRSVGRAKDLAAQNGSWRDRSTEWRWQSPLSGPFP